MKNSDKTASASPFINRDTLTNNTVQKMVRERGGDHTVLSDEGLLASRRALIPDDYEGDIWVFGYGSLIWNPVITISDQIRGRIYGYHRQFCLKTEVGRGSPGNPGLVLGLDIGGSCVGIAMKVSGDKPIHEIDLLWRREMLNSSYHPQLINFHADDGLDEAKKVVTFVMNRQHDNYFKDCSILEKARMIASATGFAGPCRDYLIETHKALLELDIKDDYIKEIYDAVLSHS
jgi:cation transport protein ChaC